MARVPENTLKFAVGVLIGSFGAFWVGEGLGFPWPGADLSILGLAAGFLVVSLLMISISRRRTVDWPRPVSERVRAQQQASYDSAHDGGC